MADNENLQDSNHELGEEPQRLAETPSQAKSAPASEKLRVHSLARVLGTTSRRIIDALAELDGRARSAHSTVGPDEADRVREVLAAPEPETTPEQVTEVATDAVEAQAEPQPEAQAQSEAQAQPQPGPEAPAPEAPAEEEPESRLILETPSAPSTAEPADYLPLFVAPQPVRFEDRYEDSDDDDEDASDSDDSDDSDSDSDDDQSGRPAAKRRRRGRRGRGRGRGEQNGDEPSDADGDSDGDAETEKARSDDSEDDNGEDDNGDDDGAGGDAGTRRRRRRRRRKSGSDDDNGSGGSPDDPPNTVVHEREPRKSGRADKGDKSDEIQGISGSTRLEAKRQRRRDGRDAGRRRPPILSEAEFLARREAVERTMVVRDKVRTEPPHEGARYTQIAVLEDGVVVEHFVTSAAQVSLVGNIYLGIVQNVLPSMEAAFVDIGRGRNGVLYAGEVNWEAAGLGGAQRKIEQALKPGDYVVVQVSKDPVGHKGARLTTQVSLAGRYLVYVPGASSTGISRKLPDTERQRLKEILREVVPSNAGVIIRTASEGVKEDDIRTDVERLQKRWTDIEAKAAEVTAKKAGAAVALYEEPDVLVKVIRDLFNEDFSNLIVSGDQAWKTIDDYVTAVAPELLPRITRYEPAGSPEAGTAPDVFAVHRIDEQLAKAMDRKVYLPSGGTLVIDRTEAMTVVDVNTGKFTGSGGNLEQTVTRNNLEAAEETVRQLRLRDIGGIVVIDFIDMVLESNRDLVLRRLTEALARDRTRHQVSEVTSLGLVQLTRKRLGTGLIEAFSTTCTHCSGRGIMLHGDPVDSSSGSNGRKADSGGGGNGGGGGGGGRRSRRGKRGAKPEPEVQVTKVPAHLPGEHPMFKAMAAANGKDEDGEDGQDGEERDDVSLAPEEVAEIDADATPTVADTDDEFGDDSEDDDSEDDDSEDDDSEDDDSDVDEIDLDDDDEDEDDDIDELDDDEDSDDEDEDDDEDDDSDFDDDDEDEDSDEDDEEEPVAAAPVGRHRRRAAARPAGPPIRD
ncbi:Rne/Rng family ribonuclease [Mycolicibacterium gilvum]|uniref:Ribonuclease E n=2 Tax=Mycolicibacterium gilvum TaxID=1804 RepID=E6TDT2_MYCSR|nr:Rne/Rng family ribonuclease [Mycolicibacterium gilvum]ABP45111.1 ribonuclease, Rne/Rng family [Mycolicibacterium gilvum PYR-GCK]ADT98723.1 ribonuclease, Rne/Rng family [Mycolicibacterium gilvum Spyr1]